jgi:hypothetical protein
MLWKDLDIGGKEGEAIYAQPKVVEVHEKMQWYKAEYGYIPNRLLYIPISAN